MKQMVDPEQYVITRRRKKYKFAKFANASNCYEFEQWQQQPAATVTNLELGAGTGLFSVELARRYPDRTFMAIDVKADRLQKGAHQALEQGISNVFFVRARADQIGEIITPDSLGSIWLTFPDPFPRERSAGRRLTHRNFLTVYAQLLRPGGQLYLKHDNQAFYEWSLVELEQAGWVVIEQSHNLHQSELSDDYKILTTYEERWLGEGRQTQFVAATKPSN